MININIFDFIIVSLAIWRISSLFVNEDGLYRVFPKFRRLIGQNAYVQKRSPENNIIIIKLDKFDFKTPYTYLQNDSEFSKLFSCIWCLSMWVSFLTWALYSFTVPLGIFEYIIISLASSTVSIVLEKR